MIEKIHCLYCDTENTLAQGNDEPKLKPHNAQSSLCRHCGMSLPDCHPHSGTYRRRVFKYAFWPIVIFCLVMMVYLPR